MKIAVVTGAAQGIGRRTAEILAAAGYSLALLDLQSCASTLASVRATGCEAADFPGDLSDETVVEATAEAIARSLESGRRAGQQRRHQLDCSGGNH